MTPVTELRVAADYESIRAIGPWLHEVLAPLDDDDRERHHAPVELAIHELATNSIDHAFANVAPGGGELVLNADLQSRRLRVEVCDSGEAFDIENAVRADPDTPQVRGYGLMIIEALAETLDYQRSETQNSWTAVFQLD